MVPRCTIETDFMAPHNRDMKHDVIVYCVLSTDKML